MNDRDFGEPTEQEIELLGNISVAVRQALAEGLTKERVIEHSRKATIIWNAQLNHNGGQ